MGASLENAPVSPDPSYLVMRACITVHSHNTNFTKSPCRHHRRLKRRLFLNNYRDFDLPLAAVDTPTPNVNASTTTTAIAASVLPRICRH
eukprot:scaffold32561_cov32-Cyclotella_meneghiniana.AAC.7